MAHYILTIAGEGSRWKNYLGVRKHFVPINGEPNINRTIRLIKQNDSEAKIHIGYNPKFFPQSLFINGHILYDGTTYLKGTESDRYFVSQPFWNNSGRTILIWGDVFFTEDAIKQITTPQSDWLRYGRPDKCIYSPRKHWGEEFALSFNPEHHDLMIEGMKKVEDISLRRNIQLYGAVYLAMLGKSENEIIAESNSGKKRNFGHMIDFSDLTDDFDFPDDYIEFLSAYKGE